MGTDLRPTRRFQHRRGSRITRIDKYGISGSNQEHRASGLNLLVTVIILWNTRYLERAVAALRQTEDVPDQLLAHLSPLGWEHVNLTGNYIWSAERPAAEDSDGFRRLRAAPDAVRKAA